MSGNQISEAQICAVLSASSLFDAAWYLAEYPDVAAFGMDPVIHYVRYGEREGRKPSLHAPVLPTPGLDSPSGNALYDYMTAKVREKSADSGAIPVVFAVNEDYAPYLSVALSSLLQNADPHKKYDIHIFYSRLDPATVAALKSQGKEFARILPKCVAGEVEDLQAKAYTTARVTAETYFRILIPRLLPGIKKCVYLDCDIVLNGDVAYLHAIDVGANILGAAREYWLQPNDLKRRQAVFERPIPFYFNAGILLINIERFNSLGLFDKCMEYATNGKVYPTYDQDILNILCNGNVFEIPVTWNYPWNVFVNQGYQYLDRKMITEFLRFFNKPELVHYNSGVKPWQINDGHFAAMFWKYARNTQWFERLVADCPYNALELLESSNGGRQA